MIYLIVFYWMVSSLFIAAKAHDDRVGVPISLLIGALLGWIVLPCMILKKLLD